MEIVTNNPCEDINCIGNCDACREAQALAEYEWWSQQNKIEEDDNK